MRIAIPSLGEMVAPSVASCDSLRFHEDDHGKIVRRYRVDIRGGAEEALRLLEQNSADVMVCPALSDEERALFAAAGILLSQDAAGSADDAALTFLQGAIAFDPANTCNACGHGHECSMDCALHQA